MNKDTNTSDLQSESLKKARIKDLLERYPNTSRDENDEILAFLKNGPILDIGNLKGDEAVRYKIAAFEDAHQKMFRTTPMEIAVLLFIFVIVALVCSMLWDIGR